jgi:hypothetical protein
MTYSELRRGKKSRRQLLTQSCVEEIVDNGSVTVVVGERVDNNSWSELFLGKEACGQ